MAIAFVQARREETQTGSRACQVDNNLTGSLLIAHVKAYAGASTGISDDGVGAIGTWTLYHREFNANTTARCIEVWTAPINTTGTRPTVTVTNAGTDWLAVIVEELSGTDVSSTPISASAFASGFSAPPWSAGTTGTPGSNEFARLVCQIDGGTLVTTPSAGYAEDTYTGNTYDNMGFASKTTSAAETPNYGAAGADEWNCYVIIVKNSGAAVPATKITFVNAGAQAASNATPQTPALPTNHAAGDLLLMFCSQASASGITFSPPAGWTSIARNNNATRSMTIEVYAKIDNGSESNPSVGVSAATAGWTVQIGAWRYVDEAVIEDAADVSSDAAAAATFQPTGITTVTANTWVLSYVCSKDDNALNYNNQNGYSDRMSGANYDTTLGNGSDQAIGVADKEFASTGAQTCPTWNQSVNGNDAWVGITIALRPKTLIWGGRGPGFIGQIQMQQLLAT